MIQPYTIYAADTRCLISKWSQQNVKQKHIVSLCLSLTEVLKFSCESNKNRSENLAPTQTNIKLIKKLKTMRQSDGHIHRKKNTEVRSEWTNNGCLWSVLSRWTFDRSLKTFIFIQHRSENDINIKLHNIFQVFIYLLCLCWNCLF